MRETEDIDFNIPVDEYFSALSSLTESTEQLLQANRLESETDFILRTTGPTISVLKGQREPDATAQFCKTVDLEIFDIKDSLEFEWDDKLTHLVSGTSVNLVENTIYCKRRETVVADLKCYTWIKLIADRGIRKFYGTYQIFKSAIADFKDKTKYLKINKTDIYFDEDNSGTIGCIGNIPELTGTDLFDASLTSNFYYNVAKVIYTKLQNMEFDMYRIQDTLIDLSSTSLMNPTLKVNFMDNKDLKIKIKMFMPSLLTKCKNEIIDEAAITKPIGILSRFESINKDSDDDNFRKEMFNLMDETLGTPILRLELVKTYIITQNWWISTTRRITDVQRSEGARNVEPARPWPILWGTDINLRDFSCYCSNILSKPCSSQALRKLYLAISRDKIAARTDLIFTLNLKSTMTKLTVQGESNLLLKHKKIKMPGLKELESVISMKSENLAPVSVDINFLVNDAPSTDDIILDNSLANDNLLRRPNIESYERLERNVVLPLSTIRPVWPHPTPQELANLQPRSEELTDIFIDEYEVAQNDAPSSDPEQNNNIIREPTTSIKTISPLFTENQRSSTLSSIYSTPTTVYETTPNSTFSTLSPTTTITTSYPYLYTTQSTIHAPTSQPQTTASLSTTINTTPKPHKSNIEDSTTLLNIFTDTTSSPTSLLTPPEQPNTLASTTTTTSTITSNPPTASAITTISTVASNPPTTSTTTTISTMASNPSTTPSTTTRTEPPTPPKQPETTSRLTTTPTTLPTTTRPRRASATTPPMMLYYTTSRRTTSGRRLDIYDHVQEKLDFNNNLQMQDNTNDLKPRIKRNFMSSILSGMTGLATNSEVEEVRIFENNLLEREKTLSESLGQLRSRDSSLTLQLQNMSKELSDSFKTESAINTQITSIMTSQLSGEQNVNKLILILDKNIKKSNKITAILAELLFLENTLSKFKKWINNILSNQMDVFDVDIRELLHHFGSQGIEALRFTNAKVLWGEGHFIIRYNLRRLSQGFNIFNLRSMIVSIDKSKTYMGTQLDIEQNIAVSTTGEYIKGSDFNSKCTKVANNVYCDYKDILISINGTAECELNIIHNWLLNEKTSYKSCYDRVVVKPTLQQDYIVKENKLIIMSQEEDTGRYTCTGGGRQTARTRKLNKGITTCANMNNCGLQTSFLSIPGGFETHTTTGVTFVDDLDLDKALIQLNAYMGIKLDQPFDISKIIDKLNDTTKDLLLEHKNLEHLQNTINHIEDLKELPNFNFDLLQPMNLENHKTVTMIIGYVVLFIVLILLMTCCLSIYKGSVDLCCAPFKLCFACIKCCTTGTQYISTHIRKTNISKQLKKKPSHIHGEVDSMINNTLDTNLDTYSVTYTPKSRRMQNPEWKIRQIDGEYFLTAELNGILYKYNPITQGSYAGTERNDNINVPGRQLLKRLNEMKDSEFKPEGRQRAHTLYPGMD